MKNAPIAVLLVNLGTPDSPKTPDVRKYLREFLLDGRVIDIAAPLRYGLVNGIIAPFRAPKSAAEYKKLWTDRGSPLLYHGVDVAEKLQHSLDEYSAKETDKTKREKYVVRLAMRYQSPALPDVLNELQEMNPKKIIVIPMFPQYASASTGSVLERVMQLVSKWLLIPEVSFVDSYPTDEKMIKAFALQGEELLKTHDYDHYVFSYHGLPQRQLKKASSHCQIGRCCEKFSAVNRLCYRAQCYETSRHLAKELGITEKDYTVCFQSRLGTDPWITPYTDDVIKEMYEKGYRKLIVFVPSFVADCLETTVEVAETYHEDFLELGGERWDMVDSLNSHPLWVESLEDMVIQRS
ncbi:ferrochelatase [Bernardetia sp. ABR2-2B]|uniref:ferrochelatase n=1 Tax=Bernardetia sp. ABR2-2B TaxID=3127472 RepID=UPI0030D226A6